MKVNYRRCISCRRVAPKQEFCRVVRVHPSHTVQLDRGMGRSAYICLSEQCVRAAQKKNRLGRSLKATVPPQLYETLRQRVVREGSAAEESISSNDPERESGSLLRSPNPRD
ncbi:YlxR family protein [Oxynema aestuarii]|uniref:YlxR family protein n=1 Tax=Oxynema aestuarii AP17 TaxID=2064643 RepID=A0A6H1U3U9_9CYAN|nr:YlxR family protein [Oxynema aestuarii]QIZ73106.1 YlxR family protein [Oxynema aestuarii AP17]RMH75463.1 MAG: YlxR family protein [Cyanobacteria bacterium J007]